MKRAFLIFASLALAADALHAQSSGRGPTGQLVYPARGQGVQLADRDKFECHEWARQQSGFDPTAMPAPATTQAPVPGTPAVGMLAGAAGGAAIAELADKDAGKGAAVGLLGAGLRQQIQQQKHNSAQQQQAQQQQAELARKRGTYDRGFGACMEARGYVVR